MERVARHPVPGAARGSSLLRRQLHDVPAFRALLRSVEATLMAKGAPLERPTLDLGCGDGHFAHAAGMRVDVGVDPALSSLRDATPRRAHHGLVAASATALPFRDGAFGGVLANSVFEHIPDVVGSIAEVARVLRRDGRFLLTAPSHRFGDLLLVPTLLRRVGLPRLARRYGDWFNGHSRHFHAERAEWWIAALAAHGLVVDEWRYYFPPAAHRAFDLLHYLGVPALLSRRLTGRWILWRNPITLAAATAWLARFCREDAVPDGAYVFLAARRR